jgi:hypothetical protein
MKKSFSVQCISQIDGFINETNINYKNMSFGVGIEKKDTKIYR